MNIVQTSAARRALLGLALALALAPASGCAFWTRLSDPGEWPAAVGKSDHLRVTRADLTTVEVWHAWIHADSLHGYDADPATFRLSPGTPLPMEWRVEHGVRIPLAEIPSIEKWEDRTGLVIAGVAGVAVLVAIAAIAASDDEEYSHSSGTGEFMISCPLIDSWRDDAWRLDSGTFGGAIFPALARTDVDNLVQLDGRDGRARIRLRDAAPETEYVDALTLLAVDHDPEVSVAPSPDGVIHTVGSLVPPVAARDFRDEGALARVVAADGRGWESNPCRRNPARDADVRDGLILEFPRPPGASEARLVVDGHNTPWAALLVSEFVRSHGRDADAWYDSLRADPARALRTGALMAREGFLAVSVLGGGGWEAQGMIREAGPEVSKRQVLPLDLSRVEGNRVHVRLESAPLFWWIDAAALDFSAERPFHLHELTATRARSGSGEDLRRRLGTMDDSYYVMRPGDAAEIEFAVPPPDKEFGRSFLARTTGWYRIAAGGGGQPRTALLKRLETEPLAVSRIAVERMNAALAAMERAAAAGP